MLSRNSTLFRINNMSFTYTYLKGCSAPTHFLVNTGLSKSLYKTICFDHTIKAYIPTSRCLHQSINGSLRRRRTWAVMLPSMKLDLWERVFSQVQGADYDENFSPVAMLKSVGIMLALAAFRKSGRWMSKQVSLPVFVRKSCM